MVTQPIEYEFSLSNIGTYSNPQFEVFHTPPDATATYYSNGLFLLTAISDTLPEVSAGPTDLHLSAFIDMSSKWLNTSFFFFCEKRE